MINSLVEQTQEKLVKLDILHAKFNIFILHVYRRFLWFRWNFPSNYEHYISCVDEEGEGEVTEEC